MTADWNPNAPKPPGGPRADRVSRLLPIEIGSDRLGRAKAVVRNLSPYGLGARGELELLPCERVTVYLPDGAQVGATVRWVRKGTFGLALDEAVDPASLRARAASSPADIVTKDANTVFVPMHIKTSNQHRPGFQRSTRDQIIDGTSHWIRD